MISQWCHQWGKFTSLCHHLLRGENWRDMD
jgi:hypothetical protein